MRVFSSLPVPSPHHHLLVPILLADTFKMAATENGHVLLAGRAQKAGEGTLEGKYCTFAIISPFSRWRSAISFATFCLHMFVWISVFI